MWLCEGLLERLSGLIYVVKIAYFQHDYVTLLPLCSFD